ncbi:MAG: PEP-CTERM sorting domain-containing protein [Luteolibacter sp.]
MLFLTSALALPATAASWVGYMNVFENQSGSQGGYIFGSGWGVSDLKTTIVTSNTGTMVGDQLLLQPNFNTYANSLAGAVGDRAFWTNSLDGGATAGPGGNKWMEANVFVETASISDLSFTFEGLVDSNTLDPAYQAQAFIKVLDPNAGYATVLNNSLALPASGSFSVTADLSSFQGLLLQTGFMVSGLNANPDNESSLGSVAVSVVPEPGSAALLGLGAILAVMGRRRKHA